MSHAPTRYFAVITGIALFAVAVLALAQVSVITSPPNADGFGPRLLPGMVAALFLLLVSGYTQAAYKGRSPDIIDNPDEAPRAGGVGRAMWLGAGLAALLVLVPYIGIGLACTVAFVLFARAFNSRRLLADAAVGLAFILCVWALFDRMLGVQLGPFLGPYLHLF
jgi:putative tricarboxylic transport membrane protein